MRLTVFGANGGIGAHVVRQALARGHEVTAVVRDPSRLDVRHPALRVTTVPALGDPVALAPTVEGRDAVLSGVGPRRRHDGPVASRATRAVLAAMHAEGVRRLVVVSAAPVGPTPDGDSFLNRRVVLPGIRALLKDLYADLRAMEQAMAESRTEWTAIRPPKLVNKPLTGRYRTAVDAAVARGYTISRADVAHAMLEAVGDPATVRRAIGIAY
ncbi:NAD(P)-dependent oxidoreductase [Micromonospora maritima]|uniref:NAD(P)-dependent oxidoreductase n=1 Tax=Micromonospora maritima TaxID=986711 RepID=UPI00157D0B26|nr:NAD(P)H-binding protein [Micromonospora maritima]